MTTETDKAIYEDHLLKGMVKACLEQIRGMNFPYESMSEEEQQKLIDRLIYDLEATARRSVDIIMAEGKQTIEAKVEQVVFKNGVKCVLLIDSNCEGRHDLADREGLHVHVIVPGGYGLIRKEGLPEADPDQNPLDLGDDDGNDEPGEEFPEG